MRKIMTYPISSEWIFDATRYASLLMVALLAGILKLLSTYVAIVAGEWWAAPWFLAH